MDTQQTSSESAQPSPVSTPSEINSALNKIDFAAYSVSELATNDDLLMLRDRLTFMASQISTLRKAVDERLIEQNVNATIGTRRIFVGSKKDTKCRDVKAALQQLLESSGGDWDIFTQAIASNGIKYGAAREIMGEPVWGKHFEVITKMELREGVEKPIKVLVDMDSTFIKPKNRSKA
jgi:hypothetical protein